MKKYALVALFAVVVFGAAFAATSGTVGLSGTVAEVFSLTLPANYSGTIANGSSAETWSIGNVTVISNVKNWTISITSTNSGVLKNSADATETIAYTVTLGSLIVDKSLDSPKTSATQPRTPKAGNTYALSISFGPSSDFYQAGTYTDTLTISIAHP
ncbi:MAG: hypothetical protein N3A02_06265 [Rectinema sp.]|nr:hypothetical protein [Rectinema sp.]